MNSEEDVEKSPTMAALRRALNVGVLKPNNYWTPVGDASVSFLLGKLLATRKLNTSVVKSSELSWKQLSENNVLFIGSSKFFNEQLASMPAKQQLVLDLQGLHNLNPGPGEPSLFSDTFSPDGTSGVAYALITHTSGPLGNGDVEGFSSRVSAGRIAAVQAFAETANAQMILSKLRRFSGELPRYYQLVLRVRFQGDVPMETSFVLYRELRQMEAK